jgi:hypothetical protein
MIKLAVAAFLLFASGIGLASSAELTVPMKKRQYTSHPVPATKVAPGAVINDSAIERKSQRNSDDIGTM